MATNERGIPEAYFVDDNVDAFIKTGVAEGKSPRKFTSVAELQAYTQEVFALFLFSKSTAIFLL